MEDNSVEFFAKIHQVTSEADSLIEIYSTMLTALQDVPTTIPGAQEGFKLATATVKNLMEMKVTLTTLVEYTAEINDTLDTILKDLKEK